MATPPTVEERVSTVEHELQAMGELIRMESRLNESRFKAGFKALFTEIDGMKRRFNELERKIDALPCLIAEMIAGTKP
jgi:hypothetical protein